jgi:3-oxoacyl-[acyl-carrier protein] reductase
MKISNKIAIVTGAAGGIGRVTALHLAQSGAKALVLSDISRTGLEEVANSLAGSGCETFNVTADMADTEQLQTLFESTLQRFGRIDIVFNNAGITSGRPDFPETPVARVKKVVELNLTSVIISTQLAIEQMKQQAEGGVIINNCSLFATQAFYDDAAYAASKAGVLHLTRCCAGLEQSDSIRVKAICPGITNTPLLAKARQNEPEKLLDRLAHIKVLEPEDVAAGVLRLIEDDDFSESELILRN